jgi:hypothetical protein
MGDLNDDPISPSVMQCAQCQRETRRRTTRRSIIIRGLIYIRKELELLPTRMHGGLFDQIIIIGGWLDNGQTGFFLLPGRISSIRHL